MKQELFKIKKVTFRSCLLGYYISLTAIGITN